MPERLSELWGGPYDGERIWLPPDIGIHLIEQLVDDGRQREPGDSIEPDRLIHAYVREKEGSFKMLYQGTKKAPRT